MGVMGVVLHSTFIHYFCCVQPTLCVAVMVPFYFLFFIFFRLVFMIIYFHGQFPVFCGRANNVRTCIMCCVCMFCLRVCVWGGWKWRVASNSGSGTDDRKRFARLE